MTSVEEVQRLLPSIYRESAKRDSPLAALMEIMAELTDPVRNTRASFDRFLDPRRAPDNFVPFLAGWLALDRLLPRRHSGRRRGPIVQPELSTGMGRLRELVASAAELSRLRGTKPGLLRFLEIATGETGFEIDEEVTDASGVPRPFSFRLLVPGQLKPHLTLLKAIIESEKPAYVTCDLVFKSADTAE